MHLIKICSKCLTVVGLVALGTVALYGDPGGVPHCPHSPENPSLILALLGTAAVAWQYARSRTRL